MRSIGLSNQELVVHACNQGKRLQAREPAFEPAFGLEWRRSLTNVRCWVTQRAIPETAANLRLPKGPTRAWHKPIPQVIEPGWIQSARDLL